MSRDYMGRAEWEDEMKAATHAPTWEIFDGSDGTTCPPGLLLSLGDGRAVEVTEAMMVRARARVSPYAIRYEAALIAALIQQAQEADRG